MRDITDNIPRYLSDINASTCVLQNYYIEYNQSINSIASVLKNYYIEYSQSKYIEVSEFTF